MTDSLTALAEYQRHRCADALKTHFHGQTWLREAFLAVPRERFVPDRVWWPQRDAEGRYPLMGRTRRPRQWLRAVYRPGAPLITQIDDGTVPPEAPPAATPSPPPSPAPASS